MDRKRFQLPDNSIPISQIPFRSEEGRLSPLRSTKVTSENGTRQDGRLAQDVRPIYLKAGFLSQSSGSAYCEIGSVKLVVAVHGPRQMTKKELFNENGRFYCEFKLATFSDVDRAAFQRNAFEKEMSILLEEALAPAVRLHMYPKSIIDVFVHVLQFDASPSTLAAAITAASIAIADAGIEMRDIVIGSVVQQRGQHWMVDPDSTEVCDNEACLLVAALPAFNEITHLRAVGGRHGLSASELVQGTEAGLEAIAQLYSLCSDCLLESMKSSKQEKQRKK